MFRMRLGYVSQDAGIGIQFESEFQSDCNFSYRKLEYDMYYGLEFDWNPQIGILYVSWIGI